MEGEVVKDPVADQSQSGQSNNTNGSKKLYRSKKNKMIAGVCSGLADYFSTDLTLIRLLFVIFAFAGGPGVLVYIVLWIVVPEES